MKRRRWYTFSGIVDRALSVSERSSTEKWEQVNQFTQAVVATYDTEQECREAARKANLTAGLIAFICRKVTAVVQSSMAESRGVFVVPLTPLPDFTRPGKVLTTRGFWDVSATSSPVGNVANFAFGMCFLPKKVLIETQTDDLAAEMDTWRMNPALPDPLLDDPGFFCYDSFVRVTTNVNQDPPFHSKTQKKFTAGSILCVVGAVEVGVRDITRLSIRFGIRFRTLIEY